MKKILVVSVLLGSSLLMASAEEPNTEMIKTTMQNLERSMSKIQKGFLYNSRARIKGGVVSLRRDLKNIDSFLIKNDADVKFNAQVYADTETKALDTMVSKIIEDFDKGDKEAVMKKFNQVLNRCVTCHALVRKW
jgi:cytochrome c556